MYTNDTRQTINKIESGINITIDILEDSLENK
jgi:hypothetical protein